MWSRKRRHVVRHHAMNPKRRHARLCRRATDARGHSQAKSNPVLWGQNQPVLPMFFCGCSEAVFFVAVQFVALPKWIINHSKGFRTTCLAVVLILWNLPVVAAHVVIGEHQVRVLAQA